MNPPPLLPRESALTTYGYCGLLLLPILTAWIFALIFLSPKVGVIWTQAGLDGKRPDFLMQISEHVFHSGRFVAGGVVLLLVGLELRSQLWRTRLRKPIAYGFVALSLCGILVGYASITVAALLAVPIHIETAKQLSTEVEPGAPGSAPSSRP